VAAHKDYFKVTHIQY